MIKKNSPSFIPVGVDAANQTLDVPHRGVTIRVLQSAAADAGGDNRKWWLRYNGAIIGQIWLHTKKPP